ncbi:hypothetical protein BVRB_022930 [Beta vulgaris subsp. vulgaris]|uniref:Uncharacterized protein n=1 Tax=Beta vulgaris subsp. vulgaris TaxID=3555 RepID=A0A0J8B360_BETVV|nr:hypothetical protein BVRB_022930 [Beta vulgaris subsp. vulgaris]
MEPISPFASALDLSPDLVEIQCSSDPSNPSKGCCNAVSIARSCQASDNPKSYECKQMLDEVVWDSYQCPRVHAADVTGIILALFLVGGLFGLRYVSRSENSQVWVRQLWGLIVKNWRMAKHRWGRQFKGVSIAMVLFGIVIALLQLTGESSNSYEVTIPSTQLTWSFTFTGPDALVQQ